MNFLFPTTVKHLPNEQQMQLLIAVTYKNKFPGFLNTNALKLTSTKKENEQFIYTAMTEPMIAESLKKPYLYIPFDHARSYILDYNTTGIVGVITGRSPGTYWFDEPISTVEVWTAMKNEAAIIVKFVHLGYNTPCTLCHGDGAVDWVDNVKFQTYYKGEIPKTRYIVATHTSNYYIIDNGWINNYDGYNIIHPCPRCMGLACDGVLKRYSRHDNEDQIEMVNFDETGMGYRLLMRSSRETIMEVPPWYDQKYFLE